MEQFLIFTITFYLTVVQCINFSIALKLDARYEWKYLEFDWDSDEDKQAAIDDGSYVQGASLPVDVDRYTKDEYDENGDISNRTVMTFITLLRKPGVPATLTTITEKEGEGGHLLRPYPDWASTKNCSGYTNVHRIAINRCGQLWILDSGLVDGDQVCPAKLVGIDLKTDETIHEVEIPGPVIKGELTNIVVQPLDYNCEKWAAYLADIAGVLIVYDGIRFCRVRNPGFQSQPEAEDFSIGDENIHHEIGLVGLSLTPPESGPDDQVLFLRPLASFDLYHANTKELRDYCTTGQKPIIDKLDGILPSQSVAQVIDANGVLFYNSVEGTSLNCWSTAENFTENKMVTLDQDAEKFQWISGMKVTPPDQELSTLLAISNRYPKYVNKNLNDDEVNFRVFEINAYLAVYGTDCY